jgi:hypothetical protein
MPKNPEPPNPIGKIASKAVWLGEVKATDEPATIEKTEAN